MAKVAHPARSSSVAPSAPSKDPTRQHHTAPLLRPANAHRPRANNASPSCDTMCRPLPRRSPRLSSRLDESPDLADMVSELSMSMKSSKDITLIVSSKHDAGLIVSDKRVTAAGEEYRMEAWIPTARLRDLSDKIAHYEASRP